MFEKTSQVIYLLDVFLGVTHDFNNSESSTKLDIEPIV